MPDTMPAVRLRADDPAEYLVADSIVDGTDPDVLALARELRREHASDIAFSAAAFEHARDEVAHSWDAQDRRVTISEAHLLTALLRVEGVPAAKASTCTAW